MTDELIFENDCSDLQRDFLWEIHRVMTLQKTMCALLMTIEIHFFDVHLILSVLESLLDVLLTKPIIYANAD